jgi:acyl-CoA synthetase (AMP-forming)/AMP-acid ligase II
MTLPGSTSGSQRSMVRSARSANEDRVLRNRTSGERDANQPQVRDQTEPSFPNPTNTLNSGEAGQSRTLSGMIAHRAAERPDHVAIQCEGREVRYAALHAESNRTAHALRAAGVRRGSRVAYLGRESEHYYEIAFACAKSEAVLVPVNWRLTAGEVAHILRDSGAELVFVDDERQDVVTELSDALPFLRQVVAIDGLRAWKSGHPDDEVGTEASEHDPVVQIYTSGTTGLPKGVVLPNLCFFTFPYAMRDSGLNWMDWRDDDRSLIAFPGFQIAGFSWAMQGFSAGVTNVVMPMFVSRQALSLIESSGVTITFVAPAMLQMMLTERDATPKSFASLRKVAYGGSPISEVLLQQCLEVIGCDFLQIYAATETGNVVTCLPPEDHYVGSPVLKAAGRACPGVAVKIIDNDGNPLPAGEMGEICVRLAAVMVEYWNQPAETARTLVDGWVHTGDTGYLDDRGYLYIGDRIKDVIISAGQNIYPAEIEKALSQHPAVADVAVVGVPHERWGESVHAVVVLRDGHTARPRELMLFARGKVADFKLPSSWDFVDALPRNPAGKVLRRQLRDTFWQHMTRKVN